MRTREKYITIAKVQGDAKLIREMVSQHNGTVTSSGKYHVEATFWDEDECISFEDELDAYHRQQDFLDSLGDEEAAGLAITL